MGEIVYKVHSCELPTIEKLGECSVYKCDCGKLYEVIYIPAWQGMRLPSIPAEWAWVELAPKWWNEETQTPIPRSQRFLKITPDPKAKRKWWF